MDAKAFSAAAPGPERQGGTLAFAHKRRANRVPA
jgi:hypothetical protein